MTINAEKVSTWLNEVLSNYDVVNGVDIHPTEEGVMVILETPVSNDVFHLGKEYLNEETETILQNQST